MSEQITENKIDKLKKTLKKTKRQKKRQKILESFDVTCLDEQEKLRYDKLVEKAHQRMSIIKKILIWGVSIYIPCWILMFLSLPLLKEDVELNMNFINFIGAIILWLAAIWSLIGPFVCFVLLIVLLIRRTKPGYYLNIKNI